ncbi:phage tail tape measure protein [Aliarcobacter skirrowii]|uniref:phage tail tape measure protein n=1 Tax=Aliarcobacter skirrowii TaxID=28200 RepID=UPI00100BE671|nr:phage tail tape measure protein [Aliarcobacter skirrowii]RXJ80818.1 phage tail tape measure protein [Aliarcobacter skirrowii]
MANTKFGITIGLGLKGLTDVVKLQNSFGKLKDAVRNSGVELKKFSKDLAIIKSIEGKQFKLGIDRENLKNELVSVSNLLRGGAFVLPVKFAMDFESSMADVKKVVDFGSNQELKAFSNDILKLSRTIPLTASELATITASGGQLGIAKNELMDFTKIVSKMGVAFDMSASTAGEAISNLKNVLSLNMEQVESLGDTINHLSDNSAAKASSIVETISRVGGVAKVFKLTADQTAALSSAFISLGKPPEVAATAINSLLNKMMTAPQQGEKFQNSLKAIGMDAEYLKHAIANNPQKTLEQFLSSLENIEDSEKMSVLTNIFGTEFADDMALLTSSLDEYRKALKLVNEETKKGSMNREFENRSATTANSLIILKNAVQEISINLGSVFLPAISGVAQGLSSFTTKVMDIINVVPGLTSVVSYSVAGFLLFKPVFLIFRLGKNYILDTILSMRKLAVALKIKVALIRSLNVVQSLNNGLIGVGTKLKVAYSFAVNGLSRAFNFLKLSTLTSATAFKVLRIALISTGIGAIVVALGLAATYLVENWSKVKVFFSFFWQGIQEKWQSISTFFSTLFSPVIELWNSLFGGWFEWIGDKLSWLFGGLSKIVNFASEMLGFGGDTEINSSSVSKNNNLEIFTPTGNSRLDSNIGTSSINITFAGDFSLFANSNGQFDFESFKQQLTKSVKDAISKEQFNKANTSIRG